MDRQVRTSSEDNDQVHFLAGQMRQALHTCSVHTVGPMAAFQKCRSALRDGQINPDQFNQIGLRIVRLSNERIRTYQAEADSSVRARKISRELQLVDFVNALFSLDLDRSEG